MSRGTSRKRRRNGEYKGAFALTSILFVDEGKEARRHVKVQREGRQGNERKERKEKREEEREREGRTTWLRNNAKTQESIQRKARITFP